MNIILWDYESVWPVVRPQNKCWSQGPIFHGPVIFPYILKTIWCMKIIIWDYVSVWPNAWPQNKCRSLWSIFHGPVILHYILKIIWCMNILIMPPTLKKLREHIGFGLSVRPSVRSSKTVHARVLKFHIWIPHGKIVDARFFLIRVISLSGVMPLWKKSERNLMHAISYEPCMLGFWISYMDSSWKNSWPVLFFLSEFSPFLELCPFEKIWTKSCQQDISKSIWARGLKLGQLIGDDE